MFLKNLKIILIFAFISIFFVSCNSEKNENIIDDSFIEESININESILSSENSINETVIVEANDENVVVENVKEEIKFEPTEKFQINEIYNLDINNDKNIEKLKYYKNEDNAFLLINDNSNKIEINGLYNYFFILDLNKEDDFVEIVFPYFDEFEGECSIWYTFNGVDFKKIGFTKETPDNGIYFNDDSSFTIYERVEILETNFIPYTYEINKNKIIKRENEIYYFGLTRLEPLKNKVDLTVWFTKNKDGESFIIPKNSEISYTCTDGKEWINIIYKEHEYWLNIKEDILVDNEDIFCWDAFYNLIIAN